MIFHMNRKSNFNNFNGNLEDIFQTDGKYIFLAGAGISIDSPSNLPSARMLIDTLVNYVCPKEVLDEHSLEIKYELLIQVFRDEFDQELKLIDFFGIPTNPNSIHFFLAQMIFNNYYVMTTNFDQLIEHAIFSLQPQGTPKYQTENLKIAITEDDYENIREEDLKVLFKLHGSNKNIITGENTKQSIITTMDAIGKSMKKQEGLFVLPLYIHSVLERICSGKTLVFLGYGGGDGLDVLPELARIENIDKIIWIEHSNDLALSIEKYSLSTSAKPQDLPKLSQLSGAEDFMHYRVMHYGTDCYKVKGRTSEITAKMRKLFKLPKSKINFEPTRNLNNIKFQDWLESNYPKVTELKSYYLAGKLFRVSLDYDTSYKYLMHGNKLFEQKYSSPTLAPKEDIQINAEIKANIGMLYMTVRNYKMADLFTRSAYYLFQRVGNDRGMGDCHHNIGYIQIISKKFNEALISYQKAISMYEYANSSYGLAYTWKDLGQLYQQKGDYEKGFECLEKSYGLFREVGDFSGMADLLNLIGLSYKISKQNLEKAMEYYEKAEAIYQQLGQLRGLAGVKSNFASLYYDKGDFENALNIFQEVYELDKKHGDPLYIGTSLRNIGKVYQNMGNVEIALKKLKEAYELLRNSLPEGDLTRIVAHEIESLNSNVK